MFVLLEHVSAQKTVVKTSLSAAGEKVVHVSEPVRSLKVSSRRNQRTLTDEECRMLVVKRRRRDM